MGVFNGYKVTSPYGKRLDPFTKEESFHQGIDLVIHQGAPIAAFVGGEVIHAGEGESGTGLGGYGNVVVIKASDNTCHLYAHLEAVKVKDGQMVKRGDIVGTQGNSGRSAGSHLHFEVRRTYKPLFGYNANKAEGTFEPTAYLEKQSVQAKPAAKPEAKAAANTYKIKAGDTLSEIAANHKMTVAQLMKLNPTIKDASKVRAGQVLKLG